MNNLNANYERILEVLRKISKEQLLTYQRRQPKLIKSQISDCTLIGDRGYLSAEIQLNLFESCNIRLNTPMRNNQKNHKKQPYIFRKKEKELKLCSLNFATNL